MIGDESVNSLVNDDIDGGELLKKSNAAKQQLYKSISNFSPLNQWIIENLVL